MSSVFFSDAEHSHGMTTNPEDAGDKRASLSRALAILDLFTAERPSWTVEQICKAFGIAVPTGYRYVHELMTVGLLMRLAGGMYVLGPRIVLLDHTMRQVDPLLRAAPPIMRELARRTGCDCVTSTLYGTQILDTHRESDQTPLDLAYGRGRPRPLFQGAAPKVILANQPVRWQHKLYDNHAAEISAAGIGQTWQAFRATLAEIAKAGHYVSRGELELQLSAIAVPIPGEANHALAIVCPRERFELLNLVALIRLTRQAAQDIAVLLAG